MTGRLVAGLNWYRAWIDRGDLRVLFASQVLSQLIAASLLLVVYGLAYGWWWVLPALAVMIPIDVYLGIAQLTGWRWDGPR